MKLSREAGFTLLEILVAVTITAILLVTIYGVFSSVSGARQRLEERADGYHRARVIFDRIGREIRSTYVKQGNARTGISGGINEAGNPFLHLTTTATTPQGGGRTGLSVVDYELVDDPDAPDQKILMRTEQPLYDAEGQGVTGYRLAEGLSGFRLRFSNGGDWQEQWDQGLPRMVEVSLQMVLDGRETPFSSIFEVSPIAGPLL